MGHLHLPTSTASHTGLSCFFHCPNMAPYLGSHCPRGPLLPAFPWLNSELDSSAVTLTMVPPMRQEIRHPNFPHSVLTAWVDPLKARVSAWILVMTLEKRQWGEDIKHATWWWCWPAQPSGAVLRKCVCFLKMLKKNSSQGKLSSSFPLFGAENAGPEKFGQTDRRRTIRNIKMKGSPFPNLLRNRMARDCRKWSVFYLSRRQWDGQGPPRSTPSLLLQPHCRPLLSYSCFLCLTYGVGSKLASVLMKQKATTKSQQIFIFQSCHIFYESRHLLRPALLLSDDEAVPLCVKPRFPSPVAETPHPQSNTCHFHSHPIG